MGRSPHTVSLFAALLVVGPIACDDGDPSSSPADAAAPAPDASTATDAADPDALDDFDAGDVVAEGAFNLLTYNVAGLPQGISSSDPEANIPLISPGLNDYQIALVQEDFWYQEELRADATHPYISEIHSEGERPGMADGLNRFSAWPFGPVERIPWSGCNGMLDCASDCLANKGFSVARHTLGPGVEIDVYNLHKEAGGCPEDEAIRAAGIEQLLDSLSTRSAGMAVVMAGDFNLHERDAPDLVLLRALEDRGGLRDACWALSCGETNIDRVFVRGSDRLEVEAQSWRVPEFVDAEGEPLSDHEPVAVRIGWRTR